MKEIAGLLLTFSFSIGPMGNSKIVKVFAIILLCNIALLCTKGSGDRASRPVLLDRPVSTVPTRHLGLGGRHMSTMPIVPTT